MTNLSSHIATLEIPVTYLAKSIAFYTDILAAEVQFKNEKTAGKRSANNILS
ncbi:hypothetical protein ACQKMD_12315 [Viridibacillus sp. NPDC096237]|uniref:hypothetical protein n=1 Tax=Viridibacillus sp. NPDC096237 TaxID=3390721 RepID=UPI003CFEA1DF